MATRKKNSSNRLLMLSNIEDHNVNKIIESIYDINDEDSIKEKEEPQQITEREPVQLIIKSEGGDMFDGFGLIDVIDNSITPIITIGYGCIMSMALAIFVSGHQRFCGKHTTFMYHECWYTVKDEKLQHHKQEVEITEKMIKMYDDYIISKTLLNKKQLDEIKKLRKDWYFNANEALKYGVVNKIL